MLKIKLFICVLSMVFLFMSCEREVKYQERIAEIIDLDKERGEIAKAIQYYSNTNPSRLKALYHLIESLDKEVWTMPHKSLDTIPSMIKWVRNNPKKKRLLFKHLSDSISSAIPASRNRKKELGYLQADSSYLTSMIDFTFETYNTLPKSLQCDPDVFFKYLVPATVNTEPIEPYLRMELNQQYHWVQDKIIETNSICDGVTSLIDSLSLLADFKYEFNGGIPISYLNQMRVGGCPELVNLVVHILRSIGVPATRDFIPQWGNHPRNRHYWLLYYENGRMHPVDITDGTNLDTLYRYASIPKVYRRESVILDYDESEDYLVDVTAHYKKNNRISFTTHPEAQEVTLNVFSMDNQWSAVAVPSKIHDGSTTFENIGQNIIYALNSITDEREYKSLVYIGRDNEVINLNARRKTVLATITRKYPPYSLRKFPQRQKWLKTMGGVSIFGSNRGDLTDTTLLYKISKWNSFNEIAIKIPNTKPYKYYVVQQVISRQPYKRSVPAEFRPASDGWKIICSNEGRKKELERLVDSKPLTRGRLDKTLQPLIFKYEVPIVVDKFYIWARNDDNNVKPGNTYELLYWKDGDWLSLRKETATDTLIHFMDVPANTAYWIKNLSEESNEEHLFMLDSSGNQFWPGVSEFTEDETRSISKYRSCD